MSGKGDFALALFIFNNLVLDCSADSGMLYALYGKPERIKAASPPFIGGADPPDQRGKEGDANVCYISGLSSDWNVHCSPCRIVLYNLSRKEIAATTPNSDGRPHMR